jgi:formylglycine-generating enzyme required for sulfatase activity
MNKRKRQEREFVSCNKNVRPQSRTARLYLAPRCFLLLLLALCLCSPSLSQKWPSTNSNSSKKKITSKRTVPEKSAKDVLPPSLTPLEFELVSLNSDGTRRKGSSEKGQVNHYLEKVNSVAFDMIEIPARRFTMGLPASERNELINNCKKYCSGENCKTCEEMARSETPQHEVKVEKFYMSRTEVTQAQWNAIRELDKKALLENPSLSRSDPTYDGDRPVERVSWVEAKEFCRLLSQKTGRTYRLPTEAEWEYSCRAGTQTPFAFGNTIYGEYFNYDGHKPYGKPAPAPGIYKTTVWVTLDRLALANAFGLSHLHGNVAEWCEDSWHANYEGAPSNSSAWLVQGNKLRIARGGSWIDPAYACRCSARQKFVENAKEPYLGFRIVMEYHEPPVDSAPKNKSQPGKKVKPAWH